MKRFVQNISIVLLSAVFVFLLFTAYATYKVRHLDYFLGENIHIIAIGPSTTGCALNDEYIQGFKNISRVGTSYFATIPMLERFLDANPQIDTVWIDHGCFQFTQEYSDSIIASMDMAWIKRHMPFMFFNTNVEFWKVMLRNPSFYSALLFHDYNYIYTNYNSQKIADYGFGYINIDRENLNNSDTKWSIPWYDKEIKRNNYSKTWIQTNYKINDEMVRDALKICKTRKITPVLFFTPLYHYDRWMLHDGFYDYMESFLEEDLLIADYEDFPLPDESYYGDVQHLNNKGAEFFSNYIATHGVHIMSIKEWLNLKRSGCREVED